MSDAAFLTAMVDVENAWLTALVDTGTAPAAARSDLTAAVSAADVDAIARRAEADGNPAIGLVALLRDRTGGETARWLHRGLTSQDVVDTALMLCLRDALSRIGDELTAQVRTLVALTEAHQHSPDAHPHTDPGRAAGHRRGEDRQLADGCARRRRHRRGPASADRADGRCGRNTSPPQPN